MAIADDLHTLFEAWHEAFKIVNGKPTDSDLYGILEELAKLLCPIQFDKEGGKHNLIGIIMYKANYTERFGAPFPRPNRPAIYDESIANGATGVIRAKAKDIHRACITDWYAFGRRRGKHKASSSTLLTRSGIPSCAIRLPFTHG